MSAHAVSAVLVRIRHKREHETQTSKGHETRFSRWALRELVGNSPRFALTLEGETLMYREGFEKLLSRSTRYQQWNGKNVLTRAHVYDKEVPVNNMLRHEII